MSSQRRATFLPRRDDAFHEHFELVRRRASSPVRAEQIQGHHKRLFRDSRHISGLRLVLFAAIRLMNQKVDSVP